MGNCDVLHFDHFDADAPWFSSGVDDDLQLVIDGGAVAHHLVLVLIPGFFLEAMVAAPPLTHLEFYYGFYGSALVWQLVFLAIAR